MQRLLLVLALLVLLSGVLGCGAHRRYTIETGANGSLAGVRTIPRDGDYDIPVDTWIRVYWPVGSEPPPEFTFVLRNGSDTRVLTYLHDSDQKYEWWFEPYEDLDRYTRYKMEIKAGEERVVSYFWTEEEDTRAPSSNIPPGAGPRITEPLDEHTVRTAQ
ncbi:MAG TPA: hypothetical protein VMX94_11645 [Armatimonadota bacterium]|nr:hypothetical protein [Armatimonadota bacterium]